SGVEKMHDPFQAYSAIGSHYGLQSPIGLQYPSLQTSGINPAINPLLGAYQQFGQPGRISTMMEQKPFGVGQGIISPQQLQLASVLATQAVLQNPLLASVLANPMLAAGLHAQGLGAFGGVQHGLQPQVWPQIGQMGSPYGQLGSPYGQL